MTALIAMLAFILCVPLAPVSGSEKIYTEGDHGDMILRIQLRLRELGYLCYRPTGVYRGMTTEAVKAFQTRCSTGGDPLAPDGRVGPETLRRLFAANAPRPRIPDSVRMPRGPVADRLSVTGQLFSWEKAREQLKMGQWYTVTDCNTGESFRLVFADGENHAEMELFAESDKQAFDKICGSEYNYLKRPVVIDIGAVRAAASLQCFPHGADMLKDNGMEGHICVFFHGSLSHVDGLPDEEHAQVVLRAAGR